MLLYGTVYVVTEPATASGVGRVVPLAVRATLLVAGGCLALAVLGRRVTLPYPRDRLATAATVLGFAVVVVNGLRAAGSVLATDGPGEVFVLTVGIAVVVGGLMGALFGLGWLFDR
jgi:hypothetical protein